MESSLISSNLPEAWHFLIAMYFSIFFACGRFFLDKFVFRRLAIWLLRMGRAAPLKFDETTQAKIVKCSESLWKLTYHAAMEASILHISHNEPWFTDTKEYFRGWPNQELK
ncbi:LAG1 longevity assurance-like protein 2 [Bienertia sinuspersici]